MHNNNMIMLFIMALIPGILFMAFHSNTLSVTTVAPTGDTPVLVDISKSNGSKGCLFEQSQIADLEKENQDLKKQINNSSSSNSLSVIILGAFMIIFIIVIGTEKSLFKTIFLALFGKKKKIEDIKVEDKKIKKTR